MGFKPGNKHAGSRKGKPNKLTASAREAFLYAFDNMGGQRKLTEWATQNPDKFYPLFAKMIPVAVEGNGEFVIRVEYADRSEPGD